MASPPRAMARRRAVRFTVRPVKSPLRAIASPVCSAMRTVNAQPSGHGSASIASCAAIAAAAAPAGRSNTLNVESPSPLA